MNDELSDEMREYLFRLSETQPVTQPEAGWPDAVAALEAKLSKMEEKNRVAIKIIKLARSVAPIPVWVGKLEAHLAAEEEA